MKLSVWAEKQGIHYRTAWNLFKDNKIPGAYKLSSGTIIVPEDNKNSFNERNVIYARVSNSQNKNNLDGQVERISSFCRAKGWVVHEVIKECASGLNDERPKLIKAITDKNNTRIIVENKDRLTRFGFNYIKTLYKGEIVVVNECANDKEDLINDFVSIITSFSARVYGKRRTQNKVNKILKELENND